MTTHREPKRLIICCDGTWMSSIGEKGAQPPSNVTRIARCLKRSCDNGTPQIILYDPGVGSSASKVDQWFGGAFGMGLEQNIREAYHFICNNYVKGDEIFLIGFSRGAFTARSVADMIGMFGLLTPDGQDHFNEIFDDYENIADPHRPLDKYLTRLDPHTHKDSHEKAKWVAKRKSDYVSFLIKKNYIRADKNGPDVKIKAIAVWDTVGTLGIPPAPIIGIRGSASQWKFTDTKISDKVENAFQALALDEPRYAFRPALWERSDTSTTNLKQVWFPGNHGGVGGGWWDQSMSDITLAWMVDQLTPLGVEFDHAQLTSTFSRTLAYLAAHPFPYVPPRLPLLPFTHYVPQHVPLPHWFGRLSRRRASDWACKGVYHPPSSSSAPTRDYNNCSDIDHASPDPSVPHPWPLPAGSPKGRPWALGQLRFPESFLQCFVGSWVRTPGRTMRVDPSSNADIKGEALRRTAESIHSSVRVRLACEGLGWDDKGKWGCKALLGNPTNGVRWRLVRGGWTGNGDVTGARDGTGNGEGCGDGEGSGSGEGGAYAGGKEDEVCGCAKGEADEAKLYPVGEADCDWKWVFAGDRDVATEGVVMELPEEPLAGYWERYLLGMNHGGKIGGEGDVWRWALDHPPKVAMA